MKLKGNLNCSLNILLETQKLDGINHHHGYGIFNACFNWMNVEPSILLMAKSNAFPWRAAHVWRLSLTDISKDNWLTGSENLIYIRKPKKKTIYSWVTVECCLLILLPAFSLVRHIQKMFTCLLLNSLLGIVPSWYLLELILSPLALRIKIMHKDKSNLSNTCQIRITGKLTWTLPRLSHHFHLKLHLYIHCKNKSE